MVIAILYALGVTPGALLLLLIAITLFKRYKTITHPAVFKTRVRLTEGEFPGMKNTWKKCYGAWVTTVFTTRKGVSLNIADVLPVETMTAARDAVASDGVKGFGDMATIASFTLNGGARMEIAMSAEKKAVGMKPWQAETPSPSQVAASSALSGIAGVTRGT